MRYGAPFHLGVAGTFGFTSGVPHPAASKIAPIATIIALLTSSSLVL
jgi:hypothetical protein